MEGRGRKSCPSQILKAFTVTEYCISPHGLVQLDGAVVGLHAVPQVKCVQTLSTDTGTSSSY